MPQTQENPTPMERGVYVEDVACAGYVGYKVIGSDGTLLLKSCIKASHVTTDTEGLFWKWLDMHDPQGGTLLTVWDTLLKLA